MTRCILLSCALASGWMLNAATAPSTDTAAAARSALSDLFTNSIVARGKGVSVSRAQLDQEVIRVKTQLAAAGRPAPTDVDRDVLDSMIKTQLVLSKATDADRAKGKSQFETTLAAVKKNAKLTDEEYNQKLDQQLRILNVTKQEWDKLNIDQATIPIVLERELKVNVTEAEAKQYYDENTATFETPEMVRAAHILIGTRDPATGAEMSDDQKAARKKQAEDLLKRARGGEDFAKLAKQYSDDPGSKDEGGEYTFPRGKMVAAFEEAAFALNTNQVSDIVTTPFGYHIIKLYEKLPAKKEPFTGLETKTALLKSDGQSITVREILSSQAIQKQLPDYFQKVEKEAGVEILDPKLKVDDTPVPMPRMPGPASTNRPSNR